MSRFLFANAKSHLAGGKVKPAERRCVNKYNAKKKVVDGITFDSKKEAEHYKDLKILVDMGLITNLRMQVKYVLIPSQRINGRVVERECSYIADFVYEENGQTIVEDVKGYRNSASSGYAKFVIKRKLMLYLYGIRIKEI